MKKIWLTLVIEAGKFLNKKIQKTAIYFTDTVIDRRFIVTFDR